jgi:hypothetical protein
MADEYLENTTPASGDVDEQFDVHLPVRTGSPASAPLRSAVADSTLEELKFALNGLGPARVESIEPI